MRFPAEVLTDDEVRALMKACKGPAFTVARHRALIALLYRGGLRISEALKLHPKDLDLEAGAVRVLWGKGGKARTVGVDAGGIAPDRHVARHAGNGGGRGTGHRCFAPRAGSRSRRGGCGG